MEKAQWLALVDSMAPDEAARLSDEDRRIALALAVTRYSTDRPRLEAADVVTDDGFTVPLPVLWMPDFSHVTAVEVPGSVPPAMLPGDGWLPHRVPGQGVILLVRPQGTASTVRLHFTLPHVVDEQQDTIPQGDREAVAHWAAGALYDSLSGMHAGDRQSTIMADSVDHASKMPNYKSLAEAHRQQYWHHMGIDPKRTVASGVVVTVGQRRLMHAGPRSRWRS